MRVQLLINSPIKALLLINGGEVVNPRNFAANALGIPTGIESHDRNLPRISTAPDCLAVVCFQYGGWMGCLRGTLFSAEELVNNSVSQKKNEISSLSFGLF